MKESTNYSRRQFLRLTSLGATVAVLAACGADEQPAAPAPAPTNTPEPAPTDTPAPAEAAASTEMMTSTHVPVSLEDARAQAEVIIPGEVVEYDLASDDWAGAFGFVTFKLNAAYINGDMAYYIRTDINDAGMAEQMGLLHVPLLNALLPVEDATSNCYIFGEGHADQLPVINSVPGMDDFSPAMRAHMVTFSGDPVLLDSEEAILAAAEAGDVTVESMNIIVNSPLIKWPEGELSVDEGKDGYLGTGQLLAAPDTENMQVTFKLHECFPGSRYIITDTSAAPMAPMMSIAASTPTQLTVDAGAIDTIHVFGNGIPGSGVMGFQPAIFGNKAGTPAWSPFWNHFTLVWEDESAARVLTNKEEFQAALEAGEVQEFNGTPDSHPTGFVVNCPVPVLAPNTFIA